jgi:predicted adenine nucleotide alpha hydrolase (AANH) superfamily ATPase
MSEAYNYAEENNFDYFTTVMTISRQKNSQTMNKIGKALEKHHSNTKYLYSDFKKKQGMDKAVIIQTECNMYRQQYCGCIYSYQEYLIRKPDNEKKVK